MQIMMNNTDPGKGHFYVSLVKSVVRIAAGVCICCYGYENEWVSEWLMIAGGLIIGAEVLGIVEEIV